MRACIRAASDGFERCSKSATTPRQVSPSGGPLPAVHFRSPKEPRCHPLVQPRLVSSSPRVAVVIPSPVAVVTSSPVAVVIPSPVAAVIPPTLPLLIPQKLVAVNLLYPLPLCSFFLVFSIRFASLFLF